MLGIALFIASIGINELMRSTVKSREQKKTEQRRENRIEAFNKDKGIIENLLAKDITEMTEEDISALNAAIIRMKGTAGNLGENGFTEAASALENRVQSMQGARLQLQQAAKDDEDVTRVEDNTDSKPSGDEVDETIAHDGQPKEEIEDEDEVFVNVSINPETGEIISFDEVIMRGPQAQPTAMPSSAPSAMPTFMPLEMSNSTQITLQPLGIIDDMRNYDFSEPVISVSSYTK